MAALVVAGFLAGCGGSATSGGGAAPSSTAPAGQASPTTAAPATAPPPTSTSAPPTPAATPSPTPPPPPAATQPPVSRTVTIAGLSFSPSAVTLPAGSTVTWTWSADVPHNISGSGFGSGSPGTAGNYSFRFSTPGVYAYQCDVHPAEMQGVVTVQ